MREKMLYVKPELKSLDANPEAYCSGGSGASALSKTICQMGNFTDYCIPGNNHFGASCSNGTSPSAGNCTSGISADGWAQCNDGSTVGVPGP